MENPAALISFLSSLGENGDRNNQALTPTPDTGGAARDAAAEP